MFLLAISSLALRAETVKINLTSKDLKTPFIRLTQDGFPHFRDIQDFLAEDADEMMVGFGDGIKPFFGRVEPHLDNFPPFLQSRQRIVHSGQGERGKSSAEGSIDFLG